MQRCLTDQDLEQFHADGLGAEARAELERHLAQCEACRRRDAKLIARHEDLLGELRGLHETQDVPATGEPPGFSDRRSPSADGPGLWNYTETLPPVVDPQPHMPLPQIEGYQVLREIGRGGMAVVYEAVQRTLSRRVALKLLSAMAAGLQPRLVDRFHREATAAARLHHTNIIPIYDFGQSRDGWFYAMELIQGQTLSKMIERFKAANAPEASNTSLATLLAPTTAEPPPPTGGAGRSPDSASGSASWSGSSGTGRGRIYYRQAARWMADAAEALHYAHSQGVIHRDVKPSNLIVAVDGRIMVADFGLAKTLDEDSVTVSGSLLGTYRYMSPEQVGAKRVRVDARTDVYSLGATLYELLAFQPAFGATEREELLGRILFKDPTPPRRVVPAVPVELQTICQKAMEKSPDARYATAGAMAEDLRRFIDDRPIVARPTGPIGRAIKLVRRHKSAAVTAATVLILGSALGFTALRAKSERGRADEAHRRQMDAEAIAVDAHSQRIDALIRQAESLETSDLRAAAEAYQRVLELDANHFQALYRLAVAKKDLYYFSADPDDHRLIDKAETLRVRALGINPHDVRVRDLEGVLLRARGDYEGAARAHRAVLKGESVYFPARINLGTSLALLGQFYDARSELLEGARLAEQNGVSGPMPWRNLGAIQLLLGDPEAKATLDIARQKCRTDVPTLLLLARFYSRDGQYFEARRHLTDALELGDSAHYRALVQRLRALTLRHRSLDAESEALETAQVALNSGDEPSWANLILAILEARAGNGDGARTYLTRADAGWPAQLRAATAYVTTIGPDKRSLWFETAAELKELRAEAEEALGVPGARAEAP